MVIISIIVAIYNIEELVGPCIHSLILADLSNAEILLIDDGSTDHSARVCDEFAQKHENVLAFHKTNGGLSDARNYGLDRARGKWIVFIDGDDEVIPDRLIRFVHRLTALEDDITSESKDTDIVLNDFIIRNTRTQKRREVNQIQTGKSLTDVLSTPGQFWNVWRYAYKREFLRENDFWFKKGILAEDMEFTVRVLSHPKLNLVCVREPYYVYSYGREGSITEEFSLRFVECMTEIVQTEYARLGDKKHVTARLLKRKLVRDYVRHAGKLYEFHGEERKRFAQFYRRTALPPNPLLFAPALFMIRRIYHLVRQT